jgi:hypothetical protein
MVVNIKVKETCNILNDIENFRWMVAILLLGRVEMHALSKDFDFFFFFF